MYSPGNVRGPASENDYLSDDRMPGGAQASAVLHDNQQDVRHKYSHSSQALPYVSIHVMSTHVCYVPVDLVVGLLLLQTVRVGSFCPNCSKLKVIY